MIQEYQIRVLPQQAASEQNIADFLARDKGIDRRTITHVRVLRKSIDARQRTIFVNLSVRVYINEEPQDDEFEHISYRDVSGAPQVIVVGAGPGGLFSALRLIELGLRPVVIERGKDVHERKKDLALITKTQKIDPESNYCFGEGGAGAYSDGKLYTRSKKRGNTRKILNVFCQHGASTSILCDAHPHIGTDKLPKVIENMRNTIIKCGGEVHFQTRMTAFLLQGDEVIGVEAEQKVAHFHPNLESENLKPQTSNFAEQSSNSAEQTSNLKPQTSNLRLHGPVILATGHSARDVYRYLLASKVEVEAKGIAVGVRLEHPSELIDRIQYHNEKGRGRWLPAAEYSYVCQQNGRGVYSFCMCPGGFVIPAATDKQQIVVNGMSPANRGTQWSNSGMVVEIHPEDAAIISQQMANAARKALNLSPDDLETADESLQNDERAALLLMQERLERMCWICGNKKQTAPAQRMADFVSGKQSYDLPRSSYAPGIVSSPLHAWMPAFIRERMQQGFAQFGRQSCGFLTNEAVMIGVETRTSAPIRILRDAETLQHIRLRGLFPCGEGAGYAGGIVSAGIDGERCAEMCAQYMAAIK